MSTSGSNERKAAICIGGMTCASCELLLEKKIKAVAGVKSVDINYKTGIATITAEADALPDEEKILQTIEKSGYTVLEESVPLPHSAFVDERKWIDIGIALLVIIALYYVLQRFDLVSLMPNMTGAMSLGSIFVIGLIAGTSTCLAVAGGLLLAMAATYNETHQSGTAWQKFRPLLSFNIGRLVSYFFLGGLVGVLGKSISLTPRIGGYLNIAIALVMFYLALVILEIIPKGRSPIRAPKSFTRWIAGLTESKHPVAPFVLGALTFFLPCGFTQSLQLVALATGDFFSGAAVMFVFAVGTLPSLLGLSLVSSNATGNFSRIFLRFSGTVVLLLALFNLRGGLVLTGVDMSRFFPGNFAAASALPPIVDGRQQLRMTVTPTGYEPRVLTVRSGIPIQWTIDGTGARGCSTVLVIPSLNISKTLLPGQNTINFTVPTPGRVAFSCSIGVVTGTLNVL